MILCSLGEDLNSEFELSVEKMVQQSLIEYIQRLLQQGYDAETIRTTLLNAGYAPYDVDTALRIAGAPSHHISTKVLLVAFLILLVLSGAVLLLLKLFQAPPAVLIFSLSLFSTQVAPGQDVVVNANIQNPSSKKVSGLIDYVVTGPGGHMASKTESFTVVTQASIPTSMSVPAASPPGTYTLQARLSYSGKSLTQSANFNVVEKQVAAPVLPGEVLKPKPEEQARALQSTCPGGCDDLNFCTNDECAQGTCVNTPIIPCCGNKQCESGESKSSCLLDCSEQPVGPDAIKLRAKEAAKSDVTNAIGICDTLAQRAYVDACLVDVSEASGSKDPCPRIVDSDVRDSCFIPFAYKNDFSVCAEITNEYMRNSCNLLAEASKTQPQT